MRKRRVEEAKEQRVGKFRDGAGSARELKGAQDIRKARKLKELKRAKNARPVRKGGRNYRYVIGREQISGSKSSAVT